MTPIAPKLKTRDLAMIVISLVIGAGIFRTPSIVAASVASPAMYFLAWGLGGLLSFIGALVFAEIGGRFPVVGGFYQIFSHAYHPALALMINWVLLLTMGASFAGVADYAHS
ncbi:MAG: amino acid permease [Bacteroidota bacterium]